MRTPSLVLGVALAIVVGVIVATFAAGLLGHVNEGLTLLGSGEAPSPHPELEMLASFADRIKEVMP